MPNTLSPVQTLETLRNSELFGAMPVVDLKRFIADGYMEAFNKGETVDNDSGIKTFNIVVAGSVKLMHTDAVSGRSFVIFLLKSGDVFDVLSLLDGKEHYWEPMTLEPTWLLRMPMENAREWVKHCETFNARFLPYIGHQMRTLENFAESVVFDDTLTRLAKLILRHTDTNTPNEEGHYPIRLVNNLSHELLAEMIGSVRSVVTTQLQKLKKEELILQRRGHLALKKLEEFKHRYNL